MGLDANREDLLQPAVVREAGEVVGDRLTVQRVMVVDVGGRNGGLSAQVGEQLALLLSERLAAAGDRDRRIRREAGSQRRGPHSVAVLADADELAAMDGGVLGGFHCPPEAGLLVDLNASDSAPPAIDARAAGVGVERFDARAGDDLQQRVEVEVGREGIADSVDGDAKPGAFALEGLEALVRAGDPPLAVSRHVAEEHDQRPQRDGRAGDPHAGVRGQEPERRQRGVDGPDLRLDTEL